MEDSGCRQQHIPGAICGIPSDSTNRDHYWYIRIPEFCCEHSHPWRSSHVRIINILVRIRYRLPGVLIILGNLDRSMRVSTLPFSLAQ